MFSILFDQRIDFELKNKKLDDLCENIRLVCVLHRESLEGVLAYFQNQNIKISAELGISLSNGKFHKLFLLDGKQDEIARIPKIAAFDVRNQSFRDIDPDFWHRSSISRVDQGQTLGTRVLLGSLFMEKF